VRVVARRGAAAAIIVVGAIAVAVWWNRAPAEEQAIRARLEALRSEINANAAGELESAVRAEQIGSFFTEDAVVDLGKSSAPIVGRSTVMGMALRLQPRTAAFRVDLDDIGITVNPGAASAEATLTASFTQRSPGGEESRDAREFALAFARGRAGWQISRVTAIDTLR
jgi:hypothetical protein